jgi:cytochrome bd ubiquinol oxidase subunit I
MKFAAFEGLYDGSHGAPLMAFGVVSTDRDSSKNYLPDIKIRIEIPNLLSYLAYLDTKAYIPGVNDLIKGNAELGMLPAKEKIERGKVARNVLLSYKEAKMKGENEIAEVLKSQFDDPMFQKEYFRYFGYGFLNDPRDLVPNVPLSFYSFHIMVGLGFFFIALFFFVIRFIYKGTIENKRKFLKLLLFAMPLAYIASQAGWVVAELGRQPWVIQYYLPTVAAVSQIDASAVQITFVLFAIVFTALLVAEISIMTKQIKLGPKNEGGK